MNKYEKAVIPFLMRAYRYGNVKELYAIENDAFEFIQTSDKYKINFYK